MPIEKLRPYFGFGLTIAFFRRVVMGCVSVLSDTCLNEIGSRELEFDNDEPTEFPHEIDTMGIKPAAIGTRSCPIEHLVEHKVVMERHVVAMAVQGPKM